MTKLYVGNLPYSYNDDALKQLFAAYGDVVATIIIDRMTGRSKGFGFVEVSEDQAQAAISEMNGKDLEGRAIVVNEARPMTERPKRDFGGGGDRGGYGNRSGGGDRGGSGGFRNRY
jgi:RNA recognition motif-containing protein